MMGRGTTLYDVLGVGTDADEQEIRTAFRELTRKHHPDRFQGLKRMKAEEHFQSITEAFNVLRRPESKEKYDRELAQGGGEAKIMDPAEIARRLAAKGAQALRDGNISQALDDLKLAVDHDKNCSRAHFFLGTALTQVQGRERDGLRHVERAAMLEPHNASIKAEAATLFLNAGMSSRAQRLAEEALALDPTSTKANEVLRQIDGEDETQGEGLLGRFRRKG